MSLRVGSSQESLIVAPSDGQHGLVLKVSFADGNEKAKACLGLAQALTGPYQQIRMMDGMLTTREELLIEAVHTLEDPDLKKTAYRELAKHLRPSETVRLWDGITKTKEELEELGHRGSTSSG